VEGVLWMQTPIRHWSRISTRAVQSAVWRRAQAQQEEEAAEENCRRKPVKIYRRFAGLPPFGTVPPPVPLESQGAGRRQFSIRREAVEPDRIIERIIGLK